MGHGFSCIHNKYHEYDLSQRSFTNLSHFSYSGLVTKAKVIDIYDGDILTIVFYHRNQPIKQTICMYGYTCPEINPSKNLTNRDLHIQAGYIARKQLEKYIGKNLVWIKLYRDDKTGRLLGDMYHISKSSPDHFTGNETSINHWMINQKYGKVYANGKKLDFSELDLNEIINKDMA